MSDDLVLPAGGLCSLRSREAGEQLFASTPRTDVWLLLECPRPWGAKALDESALPAPVKARLTAWTKQRPNTRLQLLEQQHLAPDAARTFFVALVREDEPRLYAFQLEAYESLLDIDLEALVAGDVPAGARLVPEPVFLICINARRDRCCGRFGPAVYQAVRAAAGPAAWQCTHIGGHRFAATGLALPYGAGYGRLTPEAGAAFIAAHRAGRLLLEHYRGRACYPAPAQAADYFLRAETGTLELDAFRLAGTSAHGGRWTVDFVERQTGERLAVGVAAAPERLAIYESCSAETPSALVQYRLAALTRPR
jgi:hypothetical protein